LSLGAATGMWLAAKYPSLVRSLSLHSAWTATDPFLRVVVQGWQTMAAALGNTTDMVIQGIFPWCFTPELYAAPTQVTFGRHDAATSTRFAAPLTSGIPDTELVIFEDCAHAPIYENVADFKAKTMDFLIRHS
jgi:pimeloyl-ACP methyl ester carboxylesterase